MVFPEMCHGCGGCLAVCPENALFPDKRELGHLQWGMADSTGFLMGQLRVGEAMSPPLMRQAKAKLQAMRHGLDRDLIIDAPPGVSCPAVNAVMDADVIVLVTEPTPFGLYDLKLAHEAFLPLDKPMGIVINRAGLGDDAVYDFCESEALPIWAEIPFSRDIASAYANSRIVAQVSSELKSTFVDLADHILNVHTVHREVQNA
jgi:MinD superfamily P-loop ATPase